MDREKDWTVVFREGVVGKKRKLKGLSEKILTPPKEKRGRASTKNWFFYHGIHNVYLEEKWGGRTVVTKFSLAKKIV